VTDARRLDHHFGLERGGRHCLDDGPACVEPAVADASLARIGPTGRQKPFARQVFAGQVDDGQRPIRQRAPAAGGCCVPPLDLHLWRQPGDLRRIAAQNNNLISCPQQLGRELPPDEPRPAGNDDAHVRILSCLHGRSHIGQHSTMLYKICQ